MFIVHYTGLFEDTFIWKYNVFEHLVISSFPQDNFTSTLVSYTILCIWNLATRNKRKHMLFIWDWLNLLNVIIFSCDSFPENDVILSFLLLFFWDRVSCKTWLWIIYVGKASIPGLSASASLMLGNHRCVLAHLANFVLKAEKKCRCVYILHFLHPLYWWTLRSPP